MNPQGTSFIPQRPTQGKIKNRGVRKIYILTYISYVLFFGTLFAAAGTFFLKFTQEAQLVHQQELLAAEKTKFSQSDIESIRELELRIEIAKERMNQHISVLSIFEALEKNAVQSLEFIGFSYQRPNDLDPIIMVTGKTEHFDSVLFQREVLAANPVLSGGSFSQTSLVSTLIGDASNSEMQAVITFIFQKALDPETIGYTPRAQADDIQEDVTELEASTSEDTTTSADDTAPVSETNQ